eukprot:m.174941 g.174941  ORF g.174941 m.174941 type:complete len:958 (+) comp39118_c3_seq17:304-3177(+)
MAESMASSFSESDDGDSESDVPPALLESLHPITKHHRSVIRKDLKRKVNMYEKYVLEKEIESRNLPLTGEDDLTLEYSDDRRRKYGKRKRKPSPIPLPYQVRENALFVGREKELDQIKELFSDHDKQRVVVISGFGGSGKSELAFQFAQLNQAHYPHGIFYFDLESSATFEQTMEKNAVAAHMSTRGRDRSTFIKLEGYFQRRPEALLVYDNVLGFTQRSPKLPSSSAHVHVIITTRCANMEMVSLRDFKLIPLPELSIESSVEFLKELITWRTPDDDLYAKQICEFDSHGMPLSLIYTAASINRQHQTLKQYWEGRQEFRHQQQSSDSDLPLEEWLRNYHLSHLLQPLQGGLCVDTLDDLKEVDDEMLKEVPSIKPIDKRHLLAGIQELTQGVISTTWKFDIEQLQRKHPIAGHIMRSCSLLQSQCIPGEILCLSSADGDRRALRENLHYVLGYSLLTEQSGKQVEDFSEFTMHPRIQESVFFHLLSDGKELVDVISSLANALLQMLPSLESIKRRETLQDDQLYQLYPHLYRVAGHALEMGGQLLENPKIKDVVDLACNVSWRLYHLQPAESLSRKRLAVVESEKNCSEKDLVDALVDVSRTFSILEYKEESVVLIDRILEITKKPPKPFSDIEAWAEAVFEITESCWDLELFDKGIEVSESIIYQLEDQQRNACHVLGATLNTLSVFYSEPAIEKYHEGLKLRLRAVEIYSKCLSPDHADLGQAKSNLAYSYWLLLQPEKGVQSARESLDIRRKALPAGHFELTFSLNNVGRCLLELGQPKEAEKYFREGYEVRESLPENHVRRLIGSLELSRCLLHCGDLNSAEEWLRKALKGLSEINHWGRKRAARFLGTCLAAKGSNLLLKAEDRASVVNHPERLPRAKKYFSEAKSFLLEGLESPNMSSKSPLYTREKAKVYEWLSFCCQQLGEHSEAKKYFSLMKEEMILVQERKAPPT